MKVLQNAFGPFAVQHYGPIFTCHLAAALIDVDQLLELRASLDHWLSFRTFQHVSSATAPKFWWNWLNKTQLDNWFVSMCSLIQRIQIFSGLFRLQSAELLPQLAALFRKRRAMCAATRWDAGVAHGNRWLYWGCIQVVFFGTLRVQRCKSCRVTQILEDCFEHYSLGLDSDCWCTCYIMKSLKALILNTWGKWFKAYSNHFTKPFRNHSWKDRLFKATWIAISFRPGIDPCDLWRNSVAL